MTIINSDCLLNIEQSYKPDIPNTVERLQEDKIIAFDDWYIVGEKGMCADIVTTNNRKKVNGN
jgi:hypothetical protein